MGGEDEGLYDLRGLQEIGAKWVDRIRARLKAEDDWRKEAEAAEAVYLSDDKADTASTAFDVPDFNILHSNVETIVPSIYNSTPSPDIRPPHGRKDPIAKAVSDIFEQSIAAQIEDNALDIEMEAMAQDVFVAGRGITRVKFDADEVVTAMVDPATMEAAQVVSVTNERLIYECVSWKNYVFGPCVRVQDRPWEAFKHCISQDELERLTDDQIADVYAREESPEEKSDLDVDVWEIWCRDSRQVYFVVESSGKVLAIREDPLELEGFFCTPANIVQPIGSNANSTPVCPYKIYRKLAEEADTATKRINAIMGGLKVRGAVAGNAEVVELLAEAGDNELVPVPDLENLAATGGLDKAIMWWPIETAMRVLQVLYQQREQSKQAIYEITGISDIIRGQGVASETATAQNIKTQWGALRIKKMQRMIERCVRDLFKLSAELIAKKFGPQTLQKLSGMPATDQVLQAMQAAIRDYRIDVESDSTVKADLGKNRQEMGNFLQGTSQFFSTMAPIVQQAPQAAGPIIEMYASFARQFSLGKQAEDALEQFAEMAQALAKQPPPNPEAEAKKAEMQMKAQEAQAKAQVEARKLQLEEAALRLEAQVKQGELMLQQQKLGIALSDTQIKERTAEVDALLRLEELDMEQEQKRPVRIG